MLSSSKLKCCELDDVKSPFSWDFLAYRLLSYSFGHLCRLNDCGGRSDEDLVLIAEVIVRRLCGLEERQWMVV